MSNSTVKNLEALRSAMRKQSVDAVIIPGTDPHHSEYVNEHWKFRDWVSGFTGSNGTAVVTLNQAGLWTDSRYFLQAEMQLADSGFDLHKENIHWRSHHSRVAGAKSRRRLAGGYRWPPVLHNGGQPP